jgi:hypothetical protein
MKPVMVNKIQNVQNQAGEGTYIEITLMHSQQLSS